ncbi:MAG: hypothetical protein AUI14_23455 [Actinobacteria bacterium 13_2_20CM_2_71_6]|nr:MAG: hypothetical protein AUI14_23455 [Actinobacteria bacterium 13_2_20CM_2_71_6]
MSTFTPNEVPGAVLHRQLGMLEHTGILGGVPRRQPDVVLTASNNTGFPNSATAFRVVTGSSASSP